jgi:hypothetical protein
VPGFSAKQTRAMANEDLLSDIQWSIVMLRGFDSEERIIATRRGFLLSNDLVVSGSFTDDPEVASSRIYHGDDDISGLELAAYGELDLRLFKVNYGLVDYKTIGIRWDAKAAELTPPNVGDTLLVVGTDVWQEFEFEGVREIPVWGTVLRIPDDVATFAGDGAPVVAESGGLVGIVRTRIVEGNSLSFALTISPLFDLVRKALATNCASLPLDDLLELQKWRHWKELRWDEEKGMTRVESAQQDKIRALSNEIRRLKRKLSQRDQLSIDSSNQIEVTANQDASLLVTVPLPALSNLTSELTKKKLPDWARWILMLPAAFGAFMVIDVVGAFLNSVAGAPDWWSWTMGTGVSSYAFVAAGAYTAPRHRLLIAIALAVVFGMMSVFALIFQIAHGPPEHSRLFIQTLIGIIVSIFAAAAFRQSVDDANV